MSMTNKKILEILAQYEVDANEHSKNHIAFRHILRMIPQIRVFLDENRREKVMRWLGFIQGILWNQGIYMIDELKDHNRPEDRE